MMGYLRAHYWRASRTAIQTFGGAMLTFWIAGDVHSVTAFGDVVRAHWDFSGGAAIFAFAAAMGWKPDVLRPGGRHAPE